MISEKEIKLLLDKFYEGNTTLEEEMLIDDYFMNYANISQEMYADKELFYVLRQQKAEEQIMIPDSLIHEISFAFDCEIANIPVRKERWNYKRIASIAASVVFVVAISMFFAERNTIDDVSVSCYTENENIYIPQTEVEAAAEVSRALILVGDKLNQASDNVIYTSYNIEELEY